VTQVPIDPPPAPEVSIDQLVVALEDGAYVLDVRRVDEYEEKHIPGVVLMPLDQLSDRSAEVPTDRQVWVICAAGARSMTAATALRAVGVDAVSVAGGTNKWVELGHAFETGGS